MRDSKLFTKVEEPFPFRVLIPYTKATPKLQTVIDCLRIQFVQPELVKVGDDDGYRRMLADAWGSGEFWVVEQDIIVWPGAIYAMNECAEPWCTLPSLCHGRMMFTTFGCVKFGVAVQKEWPDIWDTDKPWFRLDAHFADTLGWPDRVPHFHEPPLIHLNEVQWPDSISVRFPYKKIVWQHMEQEPDKAANPLVKVNGRVVEPEEQKG